MTSAATAASISAISSARTDMQTHSVPMSALSPLIGEILSFGGDVVLTVTGHSMEPMLHDRVSRVRLTAPRTLKRGDLPLYRRADGTYVLHRITAVDADSVTCCGDAQWILERGIPRASILAVTEAFDRHSGRWVSADSALYGAYWRVWLALRPLRHLAVGGMRRIKRLLSGTKGARP